MAEIEMDMDPSAAVAVGGEHDDDLIDYDDELIGQDGTDASPNVEAAAAKFGEGDVVLDSAAVDDTEYDLNGSAQDVPHGSHDQQDAGDREKPSGTDGLVDLGDQPHYDVQEQAGAQTNAGEDIHEIDFGYGEEHEVEDAQPQEQETWEENEEEGFDSHQDHDQTTELANGRHGADDAAAQDSHETVQLAITVPDQDGENAPGSDQAPAETHPDAVEEDEITWEEDDKVEEQEEAQVGQRQYTEQDPNAQDSEELGEAEAAVTEVEVENGSAAAHQESLDAGEAEFPAITVQYKGEEFSLFSLSSEGFFMELSVLDDNIETLLAGFRSELVNEIASEEELVFQVDELGLEYAESYPRDSLSHVTLRQILEIFDLLVKNQDPDCTRTLYTYLFTKPSTSKRFESLVDSAAAGKGLDEVMHLFESPMPHGTNLVTEAADSCHELDEYETPGDASAEDAAENAEADEKYDDYDGVGNIMTQDEKAGGENEGDVVEYGLEVDENQDQGDSHPTDAELSAEAMVQPSASSAAHVTTENEPKAISGAVVDGLAENNDFDLDEGLTNWHSPRHDTATVDTSTTNTVNNDDSAPEASKEANGPEVDDFAEIDWHEDPSEQEPLSSVTTSASKRVRTDDELDLADNKNVKRQRS